MISKCISVSLAVCIGQVFKPHSLAVSIVSPWPEPNIIVQGCHGQGKSSGKYEKISRSGKSQGITFSVREI